jgi:hypothetical protein
MKYRMLEKTIESYVCEKHAETFGPSGCRFTECPGCVMEERDRLRELIPQAWEAGCSFGSGRTFGVPPTRDQWMKQKGLA